MRAYVLVQTATASGAIASALKRIPGVLGAEDLRGPYDAIALTGADTFDQSLERIITEIRDLPNVTRALMAPLIRPLNELSEGEAA
jgi:hypothetical protein